MGIGAYLSSRRGLGPGTGAAGAAPSGGAGAGRQGADVGCRAARYSAAPRSRRRMRRSRRSGGGNDGDEGMGDDFGYGGGYSGGGGGGFDRPGAGGAGSNGGWYYSNGDEPDSNAEWVFNSAFGGPIDGWVQRGGGGPPGGSGGSGGGGGGRGGGWSGLPDPFGGDGGPNHNGGWSLQALRLQWERAVYESAWLWVALSLVSMSQVRQVVAAEAEEVGGVKAERVDAGGLMEGWRWQGGCGRRDARAGKVLGGRAGGAELCA